MFDNFNTDKESTLLIGKIADRARRNSIVKNKMYPEKITLLMDLTAAHVGTGLRLRDLLEADEANFFHDIGGIYRNLDRDTGKMMNGFLPRFAQL